MLPARAVRIAKPKSKSFFFWVSVLFFLFLVCFGRWTLDNKTSQSIPSCRMNFCSFLYWLMHRTARTRRAGTRPNIMTNRLLHLEYVWVWPKVRFDFDRQSFPRQREKRREKNPFKEFTQCIEICSYCGRSWPRRISQHSRHVHAINGLRRTQKIIININDKQNPNLAWHSLDCLSSFPCLVEKWIFKKKNWFCFVLGASTLLNTISSVRMAEWNGMEWKKVGIWLRLNATASHRINTEIITQVIWCDAMQSIRSSIHWRGVILKITSHYLLNFV